jgi:hypothetical protein
VSGKTRLLAEFVSRIGCSSSCRDRDSFYIPSTGPVVDLRLFYIAFGAFVIVASAMR